MTVITKSECKDQHKVNADEADKLRQLIERRRIWLEKPMNKMKGTYSAVLTDTIEMETELKMLETNLVKI